MQQRMDVKSPKGFAILCLCFVPFLLAVIPAAARQGDGDMVAIATVGALALTYGAWRLTMPRIRVGPEGIAYRGIWLGQWRPTIPWSEVMEIRFTRQSAFRWPTLEIVTPRGKQTAAFPGTSQEKRKAALDLIGQYAGVAYHTP